MRTPRGTQTQKGLRLTLPLDPEDDAVLPHRLPTGTYLLHSSPVCFLEPLQGQDEQLGIMLVGERREWDG